MAGPVPDEADAGEATWGADFAIDSSDPAWVDQVRAAVPEGVDVILDAIGGEVFDRGLELLAPLGRMITYGAIGGALPRFRRPACSVSSP
jgi:NADPH2:quinone reductase